MVSYVLHEVPIGLAATGTRRERDAIGSIDVPADRYWGASTQRALKASAVAGDNIPDRFFRCYGYVKKAAAMVNAQADRLAPWKTAAIARAADDLIAGHLADQFPLPVWQSNCGRDADTNVNEVLANRAAQLLGGAAGSRELVDPALDVNMGQSLGGAFTASMYIATVIEIEEALVPRCSALARAFERNPHPWSGHARRLRAALGRLDEAEGSLHEIAADPGDAAAEPAMTADDWQLVVGIIAADTARPFIAGPDGFSDRGSVDAMLAAMAAVRGLAIVLLDIVDAIKDCLDGGSRTGTHPRSEAMAMVCSHVIGQDAVIAGAACRANAARYVPRPLIVTAMLNSLRHLGDGCEAMRRMVAMAR